MWKQVKLGDVCEILDKLRKPITKRDRKNGNYPYYGATGIVDWIADYIFDEKLVLVGEDGAKWGAGDKTAFIIEGKTWVNNHAHVLRPLANHLTHEWLAYYLVNIDLSPWVTGLTVPKLNQAQLRSIPIPFPPLAEQQRIVARLDRAFAAIDTALAAADAKACELEALQSSFLTSALQQNDDPNTGTWKRVKLGDVCEFVYGKALSKERRSNKQDVPVYGANGIKAYTKKPLYTKPSIIIGRKGSAGELNKVSKPFWALDVAYYAVNKEKYIQMDYLYHILVLQNLPRLARGVKPGINRNELYNIQIALPPLAEQQRIVARLDTAFAELKVARYASLQTKTEYAALKSAILAEALQSEAK